MTTPSSNQGNGLTPVQKGIRWTVAVLISFIVTLAQNSPAFQDLPPGASLAPCGISVALGLLWGFGAAGMIVLGGLGALAVLGKVDEGWPMLVGAAANALLASWWSYRNPSRHFLKKSSDVFALLGLLFAGSFVRGFSSGIVYSLQGVPNAFSLATSGGSVAWFVYATVIPLILLMGRKPEPHVSLDRRAKSLLVVLLVIVPLMTAYLSSPEAANDNLVTIFQLLLILCFALAARLCEVRGIALVNASVLLGVLSQRLYTAHFTHTQVLNGISSSSLVETGGELYLALTIAVLITEHRSELRTRETLTETLREQRDQLAIVTAELSHHQAFIDAVMDQLPAGVVITNLEGDFLVRNEAMRTLFMGTIDPVQNLRELNVARNWHLYNPDGGEIPREEWPITRVLNNGEPLKDVEYVVQPPIGPPLPVLVNCVVVSEPSGKRIGVVALMHDLTKQKEVEHRLQQVEERMTAALCAAGMRAWDWDIDTGNVWQSAAPPATVPENSLTESGWFGISSLVKASRLDAMRALIHPDDLAGIDAALEGVKQGSSEFHIEYRRRRIDGSYRWYRSWGRLVTGSARRMTGVVIDLTDQKRSEERAKLLESAVVHARDAVIILEGEPHHGPGRSVLYVNEAFTRMTGYTLDETVGRSLHFLRGPKSDPRTLDAIRDALTHREPLQIELLNYCKDGMELWVELSLVPVLERDRCRHWVMIQRDIRDRKAAEERLRESENRLRVLGDNVPEGAVYQFVRGVDGVLDVPYISAGIEKLLGVTPEAVMDDALLIARMLHIDDSTRFWTHVAVSERCLTPFECEFRAQHSNGEIKWIHGRSMPQRQIDGSTLWNGVLLDITARKRTEESLKQSEEMFRSLFENASAGVYLKDASNHILSANPSFAAILGRRLEEIVGASMIDLTVPEDWEREEKLYEKLVLGTRDSYQILKRYSRRGGNIVWVEQSVAAVRDNEGHYVQGIGVVVDMTERRMLEEQLRQAQKMETIGQLAGGIAHDFNNLLTGVIGNLSLVDLPAGDANRALVHTAERAAQRATDLTRKLLGFARKNQLLTAPIQASEFITEVVELVRRTIDPRIEIVTEIRSTEPILADATLINQALMNLCINARDAMPSGGRITLRAESVRVASDDGVRHPDSRPGDYLLLTVSDTGTGMGSDIRRKIFEPFFTTKPIGQGTGLGLPMVHGIVRQHNGWIDCESRVGVGTEFKIFLPLASQQPTPSGILKRAGGEEPTPEPEARDPEAASKIILLVDDEEMIRDLARSVLELDGYQVIEAQDGVEAVELYERRFAEIDLVILDLTMPRLSGRDAFQAMIAIHPGAKVLLSSGYSSDDLSDVTGAVGLLAKPYRPNELILAVRRALSHSGERKG